MIAVSWLNNRKIVFKISLIVALLGCVCIGAIGFASMRMVQIDASYEDLVTRVDKSTTMAARAARRLDSYLLNSYQLALETTDEGNKRLLGKIGENHQQYLSMMAQVLKSIPEKADGIKSVVGTFETAFAGCDSVIKFAASTTTAEEVAKATGRLKSECVPAVEQGLLQQAKMLDDLIAYAALSAHELKENTTFAIKMVIGLVMAGLSVGLALAMWIGIFGLARPIARLKVVMAAFAGNDLKADVPGVERRDELGEMAKTVEIFKVNAKEVERLREEQLANERRIAVQRKADMSKLANDFEGAVGEIIRTVSAAATELEASANTLSVTATKAEELSTVVASAAEEASANVQSVASASEEMTSSVSEIGRQVQESARIANDAVAQADKTNGKVSALAAAANKIGDVVNLINTIAEQTNLLALNATIEAARAGEAGRGFAVVASEVKSLAEQTAKATGEIGEQIKGIQLATTDSVDAIKNIGGTIVKISEISAAIAAAVEEQGAATQEITRNVQQAAQGTTQVASNIVDVQRGSSETGAASSQVLSSAQSLSVESVRLKNEVDKFMETIRAA